MDHLSHTSIGAVYGRHAFETIYEFLTTHEDDDKYRYTMVGYRLKNTVTDNGHVARGVCELNEAKRAGWNHRAYKDPRSVTVESLSQKTTEEHMDNYRRRYSCIHEYVGIHKKYFR